MLRAMGIPQWQMREQHHLIWVVLEMNIRFHKAAKLDDELLATAAFEWMKGARLGMSQRMTRTSDDALIATAELSVVMLHADTHKPARMPAWIKAELEQHAK
jgi:acyl-CoA thioester hydrolase